jgi:hypothetical protein
MVNLIQGVIKSASRYRTGTATGPYTQRRFDDFFRTDSKVESRSGRHRSRFCIDLFWGLTLDSPLNPGTVSAKRSNISTTDAF